MITADDIVAFQRVWSFSDIQDGDVFWLSADSRYPHHCKAEFSPLNPDGRSRDFYCLNGAWRGTLTEMDEGALALDVHQTGSRHFVYLCEKVESVPCDDTEDDEVAF